MKLQYTLLLATIFTTLLQAQIEVPILQNPVIKQRFSELDSQYPKAIRFENAAPFMDEKMGCELEQDDINYVEAGQSITVDITIDISQLEDGQFECFDCDDLVFGTASINDGQLSYVADTGIEAEQESVTVVYCIDGGDCPKSQTFNFVVKRPGTTYFPNPIPIEGGDRQLITADDSLLPGGLACSFFADCTDNYEGREQLVYFTTYSRPDNQFVYDASRYAGTDRVCLVLCDSFTICDTFNFAFQVRQDTLDEFPIFDDFSLAGPYPNDGLWLDREVFVNDQFGVNPPSIGVATFDGINYRGDAYPANQPTSDRLTSTYLNLSNQNGELFINFWLQRKGLGDRPEPADSLVLQFKRNTGTWETISTFEGSPLTQPSSVIEPFTKYSAPIPSNFRHKGFQFRFQAYSDNKGVQDTWNLDYVRIDDDTLSTFNDVAFTMLPTPILDTYTSMPWVHFNHDAGFLEEDLTIGLYNHFIEALDVAPSYFQIRELYSSVSLYENALLNGQEANVDNGMPVNRVYNLPSETPFSNNWSDYVQIMSGSTFDNYDRLEFITEYLHETSSQQTGQGFELVLENDYVARSTIFDNYFAYDLGIAETSLAIQETWQVAVQFQTAVADSLQAIRIHFPHTTGDVTEQLITLQVWIGELDDTPEYEQQFITPYYASNYLDTLQGFTSFPIVDVNGEITPLYLPAGTFYVGWQQESDCDGATCVPVGFDKNRPEANSTIFRNLGTGWGPLPSFLPPGALMIRPVVGNERQGFTPVEELNPKISGIRVFPNPATDYLQVQLADQNFDSFSYELYDSVGRRHLSGNLEGQIDVAQLPAGMYILRIFDKTSNQSYSQRVVILNK